MNQPMASDMNNTAVQFMQGKYLCFPTMGRRAREAVTQLASTVQEFVDGVDKSKITKDVKTFEKRNWIMRLWDLTNEPVEKWRVDPVTDSREQYKAILKGILYSSDRKHLPVAKEKSERVCKMLLTTSQQVRMTEMADAGNPNPKMRVDFPDEEIALFLGQAAISLAQMPKVYHKLYMDALATTTLTESGRAKIFAHLLSETWTKAGCKNAADVQAFERRCQNMGALNRMVAAHSQKPKVSRTAAAAKQKPVRRRGTSASVA